MKEDTAELALPDRFRASSYRTGGEKEPRKDVRFANEMNMSENSANNKEKSKSAAEASMDDTEELLARAEEQAERNRKATEDLRRSERDMQQLKEQLRKMEVMLDRQFRTEEAFWRRMHSRNQPEKAKQQRN